MLSRLIAGWGLAAAISGMAMLAGAQSTAPDIEYFRYTDENGNLVIDRTIPSQYAGKGYDVLDDNGRLLRQVPRALTPEEFAQKQAREAEQKRVQAQEDAQRDYDVMLLRKYSFVSDIESEQKRKVNELKVRLAILKGNLKTLRSEIELEYEKAARIEQRGGNAAPVEERIQLLENKIITTEATLLKHQESVQALSLEYEQAIARFKQISDLRQRRQQN